ncbi:MAG: hypothetical protein GY765_33520 [bacterium]|nr:hypothetical protein [bacterium]
MKKGFVLLPLLLIALVIYMWSSGFPGSRYLPPQSPGTVDGDDIAITDLQGVPAPRRVKTIGTGENATKRWLHLYRKGLSINAVTIAIRNFEDLKSLRPTPGAKRG